MRPINATDREQREAEGRQKREWRDGTSPSPSPLRSALESTTDGILVVDNSGNVVPFSQRFASEWRIPRTVVRQLALENCFRHALEREEFLLYYEPQVNVRSGQILGVEALSRWQHPELGLVAAGEFIPLMEETPFILALGEWVLRTACRQNKAWRDAGLPQVRMSVNLSARQFQEPGLVEMVARTLDETGLDPDCLDLEITEGIAMQDANFTTEVLRELVQKGIRISIDDFGTGYSSLSYLKNFPIHALKVDQSFVRNLTTDPKDAAIVAAIIAMAHIMELNVIAEGVESEDQLAFLRKHECDEFQGYLIARPMPAEDFQSLLEQDTRLQRQPRARAARLGPAAART